MHFNSVKNVQLLRPLFEFSGACGGCGETPYVQTHKPALRRPHDCCQRHWLLKHLRRPYCRNTVDKERRGLVLFGQIHSLKTMPSLAFGMQLALKIQSNHARKLVLELESVIGSSLTNEILTATQTDAAAISVVREKLKLLKERLQAVDDLRARDLLSLADTLTKKSVWIIGGDGWALSIGCGGLDHVLASGEDVNILVLDTEVYSNTGGQASKATARGAVAKAAAGGKSTAKGPRTPSHELWKRLCS